MRIIAGEFRGRRLKAPKGSDLRPTGDRLKESLFNILGPSVRGAVFADVFAGTGAIGLEALSRGAREVVFLESGAEGCRLIRQNLEICGVEKGFRLLRFDVFTSLRALAREGFCADIVFVDPPYDWGPYGDVLEILFRAGLVGESSPVVVEHHRKNQLPETSDDFCRFRLVRQGDKCLSFYRMKENHLAPPGL